MASLLEEAEVAPSLDPAPRRGGRGLGLEAEGGFLPPAEGEGEEVGDCDCDCDCEDDAGERRLFLRRGCCGRRWGCCGTSGAGAARASEGLTDDEADAMGVRAQRARRRRRAPFFLMARCERARIRN